MAAAKKGDTVTFHYEGKLRDGTVFDTTKEREPLEVKIGEGVILVDLENEIVGMSVGEKKTVSLTAEQGYGPHRKELVVEVPRNTLAEGTEPQIGQYFQVEHGEGQVALVKVVAANEDTVSLDANHPLAGEDLVFDVEIVEVTS